MDHLDEGDIDSVLVEEDSDSVLVEVDSESILDEMRRTLYPGRRCLFRCLARSKACFALYPQPSHSHGYHTGFKLWKWRRWRVMPPVFAL